VTKVATTYGFCSSHHLPFSLQKPGGRRLSPSSRPVLISFAKRLSGISIRFQCTFLILIMFFEESLLIVFSCWLSATEPWGQRKEPYVFGVYNQSAFGSNNTIYGAYLGSCTPKRPGPGSARGGLQEEAALLRPFPIMRSTVPNRPSRARITALTAPTRDRLRQS
jgi:hypothetical protein